MRTACDGKCCNTDLRDGDASDRLTASVLEASLCASGSSHWGVYPRPGAQEQGIVAYSPERKELNHVMERTVLSLGLGTGGGTLWRWSYHCSARIGWVQHAPAWAGAGPAKQATQGRGQLVGSRLLGGRPAGGLDALAGCPLGARDAQHGDAGRTHTRSPLGRLQAGAGGSHGPDASLHRRLRTWQVGGCTPQRQLPHHEPAG
mmetsp:Transcript_1758/g.5779  ORF Transcript_1758/g.5779 Transcript_1758/m.5779 type:complete len:203 (-) Transcript_1758:350-958(-)